MYLKSGITVLGAVLPLVSLASIVRADVGYPSGTQNFETMNVGGQCNLSFRLDFRQYQFAAESFHRCGRG